MWCQEITELKGVTTDEAIQVLLAHSIFCGNKTSFEKLLSVRTLAFWTLLAYLIIVCIVCQIKRTGEWNRKCCSKSSNKLRPLKEFTLRIRAGGPSQTWASECRFEARPCPCPSPSPSLTFCQQNMTWLYLPSFQFIIWETMLWIGNRWCQLDTGSSRRSKGENMTTNHPTDAQSYHVRLPSHGRQYHPCQDWLDKMDSKLGWWSSGLSWDGGAAAAEWLCVPGNSAPMIVWTDAAFISTWTHDISPEGSCQTFVWLVCHCSGIP